MSDDNNDDKLTEYERNIAQEMQQLADKREEIRKRLEGKTLEDPVTMKIAKDTVLDLIPDAALQIRYLINHAESETIRKDLAKYILNLGMQSKEKLDEEDELTSLLKDLTKPNPDAKK